MRSDVILASAIVSVALLWGAWLISQNGRWQGWVDVSGEAAIIDTRTGRFCTFETPGLVCVELTSRN